MRADMHMHSIYSDGALTPSVLVKRVKEAGVSLFSVTDHDSMESLQESRAAARREGLAFVSGWEVSSYSECKVHVLGYACERNDAYYEFLSKRMEGARLRADDMRTKANAYLGLNLTMDDIEALHAKKDAPIHTFHVVTAFAQRLQTEPVPLYLRLFDAGKPACSSLHRPTPFEAIDGIHATGGIAVLAHPGRIALAGEKLTELMTDLVSRGLDGIECYYTTHTCHETEAFLSFAASKKLLVTGGSDFHADDGIHVIGRPPFEVDEKLLDALSARGGLV